MLILLNSANGIPSAILFSMYIRILDRAMIGYGFHTVCVSWESAIATWFDRNPTEPIAIRIVNGYISVFRG